MNTKHQKTSITKRPLSIKQTKAVQNNRIKVWEYKAVECLEIHKVKVGNCVLVLRCINCIHCIKQAPFHQTFNEKVNVTH